MTTEELREHPEYLKCMDRIRSYRPGFTFTINFSNIPEAKANALRIVLRDAVKAGYLESVSMGIDLNLDTVEERYKRR